LLRASCTVLQAQPCGRLLLTGKNMMNVVVCLISSFFLHRKIKVKLKQIKIFEGNALTLELPDTFTEDDTRLVKQFFEEKHFPV
jgi:hypothetical protein